MTCTTRLVTSTPWSSFVAATVRLLVVRSAPPLSTIVPTTGESGNPTRHAYGALLLEHPHGQ